jgi:nitric oxide synthase-interacting protein
MPSRHSKNASDQHHFTYHEREQAGYGTQKTRFGADSQLPFGHCALCIKPCDDPMATPSGRLYCRECIVSYLLQKTRDLKHARVLYDAQESAKEVRLAASCLPTLTFLAWSN